MAVTPSNKETSGHTSAKKQTAQSPKSVVLGQSSRTNINELLAEAAKIQGMSIPISRINANDIPIECIAALKLVNNAEVQGHLGDEEEDDDSEDEVGGVGDGGVMDEQYNPDVQGSGDVDVEAEETVESLKAALKKVQEDRDGLKAKLNGLKTSLPGKKSRTEAVNTVRVPWPSGTAGKDFSIQVAMGLAGSEKKDLTYRGIQCRVHEFVGYARIGYEVPRKNVPAKTKADLFESLCQDQPFLAQFENDWAAEELAKQFLKNKCKNAYKHGWLVVPPKYAHLKQNAQARSSGGSRRSKVKEIRETKEQKKATKAAKNTGKQNKKQPESVDRGLVAAPSGEMMVAGQVKVLVLAVVDVALFISWIPMVKAVPCLNSAL
ncbi:hypothetical protein AAF712_013312 [Marasmius tenuissimus]|uniref:Uncharacterized protein n=1 Tax=Marasmius tenuissimus TaxID=585030 RepID=A0ABR2ZE03_9AGAR